jgi:hypothetical protein
MTELLTKVAPRWQTIFEKTGLGIPDFTHCCEELGHTGWLVTLDESEKQQVRDLLYAQWAINQGLTISPEEDEQIRNEHGWRDEPAQDAALETAYFYLLHTTSATTAAPTPDDLIWEEWQAIVRETIQRTNP